MKKFLLVVLVGMVLAIDIYGIVEEYKAKQAEQAAKDQVYTVVYEE